VKTFLTTLVFAIILSGCATATIGSEVVTAADKAKMASIIAARTEDDKARDTSRNPQQTLEFFGITSDMAVAEVLPGRLVYKNTGALSGRKWRITRG